uniref:Uncharacterized protein n=1 Tax=Plectus sambesii TaxID=2011161 RepID=A0A914UQM0_9BILA
MKLALKRKADYNQNESLVNGARTSPAVKRVKTATPSPPQTPTVASTRQKVLPTADLVKQMMEDLPVHMAIDLREHEHKVREEHKVQESADKVAWERRKEREDRLIDKEHRRREKEARREEKRKQKNATKLRHSASHPSLPSSSAGPPTQQALKTDLVQQFLDTMPSTSTAPPTAKSSYQPLAPSGQPRDWYADLPPIDFSLLNGDDYDGVGDIATDDDLPAPTKSASALVENGDDDGDEDERLRHRSVLQSNRDRQVLALPYVDIGLPDFIEYSFPDQQRYLAEENFVFGRSRPAAVNEAATASATPTSSR